MSNYDPMFTRAVDRLCLNNRVQPKDRDRRGASATLRFTNGEACCTSTYNYRMHTEERAALARRIAAALNATRHLTTEQLELMANHGGVA